MKILKYTFIQEQLGVKDGEIVELDPVEITCNFSLTTKAMGMFEEEYGEPCIEVLLRNITNKDNETYLSGDELGDRNFIMSLASCTYLKIENNEVFNNEATRDEFKTFEFYKSVASDIVFRTQLIGMAFECINSKQNKKNNKKGKN